jgi:hypothetical protein
VAEIDETTMGGVWVVGAKARQRRGLKLQTVTVRDISTLHSFTNTMLATGATALTDEWGGYFGLHHTRPHLTVCHAREFVSKNHRLVHTNGIEGIWGHAKPKAWHTYRKFPTLSEYLKEVRFHSTFTHTQRRAYLHSFLFRGKTNTVCT